MSPPVSTKLAAIGATDFDPTADLFVAQDQRPATLDDIHPASLSPLMRALIVIDGTVTKFLEAYSLEPMDVRRLAQSIEPLAQPDRWLDASAGAPTAHRFVMLVGRETGRLYAWAESRIVLDRLTDSMRRGLDEEVGGLGQILLANDAETRREGLWYGAENRIDLPEAVAGLCDGSFVTRAYRVIANGLPLMTITERFPIGL